MKNFISKSYSNVLVIFQHSYQNELWHLSYCRIKFLYLCHRNLHPVNAIIMWQSSSALHCCQNVDQRTEISWGTRKDGNSREQDQDCMLDDQTASSKHSAEQHIKEFMKLAASEHWNYAIGKVENLLPAGFQTQILLPIIWADHYATRDKLIITAAWALLAQLPSDTNSQLIHTPLMLCPCPLSLITHSLSSIPLILGA